MKIIMRGFGFDSTTSPGLFEKFNFTGSRKGVVVDLHWNIGSLLITKRLIVCKLCVWKNKQKIFEDEFQYF